MSKKYSPNMLPGVNYDELIIGDFDNQILDLEYETMRDLDSLTEEMKKIFLEEGLMQVHHLILAHLCGYLGSFTMNALGRKSADNLIPSIEILLKDQAYQAYELFSQYPVNADLDKQIKQNHLQDLRRETPGSLAVQTIRLGRVIFDALQDLYVNRLSISHETQQEELFCDSLKLLSAFKKTSQKMNKRWKNELGLLYPINQTAVQIAWVMGYFSHLDKKDPAAYLDYGIPCVRLYADFTYEITKRGG